MKMPICTLRLRRALCWALVLCFALATPQSLFAETPKEKLARLQQELSDIQNGISASEGKLGNQQATKQYYQQQTNNLRAQIEVMNLQISETQTLLTQQQDALAAKLLEVTQQQALFEQRLTAQYMNRSESTLTYALSARGWSGALRYRENLQHIAESDTALIQSLRVQQAELEQQKADTEATLALLSDQQAALDGKVEEYTVAIQQTNAAIDATQAALDAQTVAYGDKYDEMQRAKQELQAWIAQTDNVDFAYGGGPFTWPIPGHNTVSSNYGWRNLWGKQDFHYGVDFSAGAGTPIVAAADGVVSTKADWSYGICVKLNHGSGIVTVYGHMLARAEGVTDGVFVTAGQTIGYVGSTGNSSGNHLHFQVNENGSAVNPWSYLNG